MDHFIIQIQCNLGEVLSARFGIKTLSVEIAEFQFNMIPVFPDHHNLLSVCKHFAITFCVFTYFMYVYIYVSGAKNWEFFHVLTRFFIFAANVK